MRQIKIGILDVSLDTSQVNSRDPESYKSDPTQNDIHTCSFALGIGDSYNSTINFILHLIRACAWKI